MPDDKVNVYPQKSVNERGVNTDNIFSIRGLDYFKKGNIIGDHLQAQHKLIMEGRNFGWGAVIGAAIGGMTGWASGLIIIALPLGLAIGCLAGWIWESKARKDGKTI